MMLMTEAGIMAEADARVFNLLMAPNRTARRLMAADRTIARAYARVATLRRMQETKAARDHARADRELARELEASTGAGWGRTFFITMPVSQPPSLARASTSAKASARPSAATRAIRAYAAPLRDDRGRVALYMNIKYRGLKSKGWRPGLSADHVGYILRELALELAEAQLGRPISNMGETTEEIMACWRALEEVEAGYRANAKVQYRIVWNLPHELDADQRRVLVEQFCERTFGRLGLPYVAAIHEPDTNGDRRNYHAHICFSTRPCEHIGDHRWAIAEEKVNGLTDNPGLRLMRALAAAHMNRTCRAAGLTTLFTHQTYAERGLDAERQAHVGQEAMAAHDRGEAVGVIARNALIVERNETAVARQQAERQLDATLHLQRLLEEAERAVHRRSAARAGRQAAQALLEAAKDAARRVLRAPQSSKHLGVRALELRARAVSVQRRLLVPSHRAPNIQPVTQLIKDAVRLGHRPAAGKERPAPAASVAASRLSTHARSIARVLAERPVRRISMAAECVPLATTLAGLGTSIATALSTRDALLVSASRARADLRGIEERHGERRAAEAIAREAAVRDAVLTSSALIVTVESGRVRADLSGLPAADRNAFLALDTGIQRTLLLDRHAADQRRRRDEADRIRADDLQRERDADIARRNAARIEEACRILREAEVRPYRRNGRTLHLDLAPLSAIERDLVASVGINDPSLRAALVARAKSDAQIDAAATAGSARSSSVAERPPGNATPAPGADGADDRIAAALVVLRARDDWVRQDADGMFTFSDAALQAAGLSRADIVTPIMQREIEAIGFEQVDRFEPVLADVSGRPPFLVDQGKVRLDPRFPAALRDNVARWGDEPQFRAFVATVWPHLGIDRTPASGEIDSSAGEPLLKPAPPASATVDPWFQAATVRQRAMADWDATERNDDIGMARPGQTLARPGRDAQSAETISGPVKPARFHPGMIPGGSGIGG